MTPAERRAGLHTAANPAVGRDYVVALEGPLGEGARLSLHYVPDRVVLERAAFARYLAMLEGLGWRNLEQIGAAVLDDINNELVPRWLRVEVVGGGPEAVVQRVRLEDHQPRWANDVLLRGL